MSDRNPKLAVLGDSITFQNSPGGNLARDHGYANWLQFLSGQKFDFDSENVFGYSGQTTDVIKTKVDNLLSIDPDYVILLAGTNDITGKVQQAVRFSPLNEAGYQAAVDSVVKSITGNLEEIVTRVTAADAKVVMVPILPRAWWDEFQPLDFNDPVSLQKALDRVEVAVNAIEQVNEWVRNFASNHDQVLLADPVADLIDPNLAVNPSENGGKKVVYDELTHHVFTTLEPNHEYFGAIPEQRDAYGAPWRGELHPGIQGAEIIGRSIFGALSSELAQIQGFTDQYDNFLPTTMSFDAHDTYKIGVSDAGTRPGNTINGEIVEGWVLTPGYMNPKYSSSSNQAYVKMDEDGAVWQHFDFNLKSEVGQTLVVQTFTHSQVIAVPDGFDRTADQLVLQADISIMDALYLQQVSIIGEFIDAAGKKIIGATFEGMDNSDKGYWPTHIQGTLSTPYVGVPDNAVGIRMSIKFGFDLLSGSGTGQSANAKIAIGDLKFSHITSTSGQEPSAPTETQPEPPPVVVPEEPSTGTETPASPEPEGYNTIYGTDGRDTIGTRGGKEHLSTLAGDDYLAIWGAGESYLDGGAGNDRFGIDRNYLGSEDRIDGGTGRDTIIFKHAVDLSAADLSGVRNVEVLEFHANSRLELNASLFEGLVNGNLTLFGNSSMPILIELDTSALNPGQTVTIQGNLNVILSADSNPVQVLVPNGFTGTIQKPAPLTSEPLLPEETSTPEAPVDVNIISGTNGRDNIGTRGGTQHIRGLDGDDYLAIWGEGSSFLDGGNGNDTFGIDRNYLGSEDAINGGDGRDKIVFKHSVDISADDLVGVSNVEVLELRDTSRLELISNLIDGLTNESVTLFGNGKTAVSLELDTSRLAAGQMVVLDGQLDVILSAGSKHESVVFAEGFKGSFMQASSVPMIDDILDTSVDDHLILESSQENSQPEASTIQASVTDILSSQTLTALLETPVQGIADATL